MVHHYHKLIYNTPTMTSYNYILDVNCTINGSSWQGTVVKDEKHNDVYGIGSKVLVYYDHCPPSEMHPSCKMGTITDTYIRQYTLWIILLVGLILICICVSYGGISRMRSAGSRRLRQFIRIEDQQKDNESGL